MNGALQEGRRCACYESIVLADGFARTAAGAQSIVSVLGWWDRRCWARCLVSKFQGGVVCDLGGDASANIEIRVFPKIWNCKDSIGSATLLEPTGFLGSGVLPTK